MKQLAAHGWPLNETELHNLLGALAGRREGGPVQLQQLLPLLERGVTNETDRRSEKDRIVDALVRNGCNRNRTDASLGMSRQPLYQATKGGVSGNDVHVLSALGGVRSIK